MRVHEGGITIYSEEKVDGKCAYRLVIKPILVKYLSKSHYGTQILRGLQPQSPMGSATCAYLTSNTANTLLTFPSVLAICRVFDQPISIFLAVNNYLPVLEYGLKVTGDNSPTHGYFPTIYSLYS